MIILPAIDIIDGSPVRLYKGDYNKKEIVGTDVLTIARQFEQANAEYIHIVDLDGAKEGQRVNSESILSVVKEVSIPVELGGGIRTMEDIDFYLQAGVKRIILGTAALSNIELVKEAVQKYADRIAIGLDCKDGFVCVNGWLENSKENYIDTARRMETLGVKTIIFTDISKDGTLQGPNVEMLKALKEATSVNIIASGGIRDVEHIRILKKLGVYGAITGKAIYANTLNLEEAIQICKE